MEDPSNADPAFRRTRIRHELLPLLDDIAQRDVVPVLARQAALLATDADFIASEAVALDPTDAAALVAAPLAVARAAVREWLRAGVEHHPPDAATVERVLAVARKDARATDAGDGRRVERHAGRLVLVDGPAG